MILTRGNRLGKAHLRCFGLGVALRIVLRAAPACAQEHPQLREVVDFALEGRSSPPPIVTFVARGSLASAEPPRDPCDLASRFADRLHTAVAARREPTVGAEEFSRVLARASRMSVATHEAGDREGVQRAAGVYAGRRIIVVRVERRVDGVQLGLDILREGTRLNPIAITPTRRWALADDLVADVRCGSEVGASPGATQWTLGWIFGAASLAALGASLIAIPLANSAADRYGADPTCRGSRAEANAETSACQGWRSTYEAMTGLNVGGYVAAGALAVTSIVLFATAPSRRPAAATTGMRCGGGPGQIGVTCGLWF